MVSKKKKTKGQINKLNYISAYGKENYYSFSLKFRKDNTKVIDKLQIVPSKSAYILNLIEDDIKKEGN